MVESAQNAAEAFQLSRAQLIRVAYRMLGSIADAEDVVQEAFIRWTNTDREVVRDPSAFLVRIVTHLCLDVLKSARRRRETYPGPWLPEPMIDPPDLASEEDVTLPLLLALERLSPLERAAFLLHDVFGMSFQQVAVVIGKQPVAIRQLASRARTNVRQERRRFSVTREHSLIIAQAFFDASRTGQIDKLQALLSADVRLLSDGGGRRSAADRPVEGIAAVIQLHRALARVFESHGSVLVRLALVNGLPGFVTFEGDRQLQTTALQVDEGLITHIYIMRNPDKLTHLTALKP